MVAHEVHRIEERRAPFLAGVGLHAAAAVGAPSLHAMRTTPRARMVDDETALTWMHREVVAEVGDDDVVAMLQGHNHAREFRRAALLMMPEGFAVSGEQDRTSGFMLERDCGELIGKRLAI